MGIKAKIGAFLLAAGVSLGAVKGVHDYNKYIKNDGLNAGEVNPPAVEDVVGPAVDDAEDVKDQIDNSQINEDVKTKLLRLIDEIESNLATAQADMSDGEYKQAQNRVVDSLAKVDEVRAILNIQPADVENLEEIKSSADSLEMSLRNIHLVSAVSLTSIKYAEVSVKQTVGDEVKEYQTFSKENGSDLICDGEEKAIISNGLIFLEDGVVAREENSNIFTSLMAKITAESNITKDENGNYVVANTFEDGKTETIVVNINDGGEIAVVNLTNANDVNYEMNFKVSSLTDYNAKFAEISNGLVSYMGYTKVMESLASSYKEDESVKIEQEVLMDNETVCKIMHVQSKRLNLFVEGITYSKEEKTEYIEQKQNLVTYIGRNSKGNVVLETKEGENLDADYCAKMFGLVMNNLQEITKIEFNEAENIYTAHIGEEGYVFEIRLDSRSRIKRITYTKGVETQVYSFKEISRVEFDRLYAKLSAEIEQLKTEYNVGSNL